MHVLREKERERERESIKKQRVLKVKERIWVFIIFYTKPIRPSHFFSPTHNTHIFCLASSQFEPPPPERKSEKTGTPFAF